MENTIQPGIYKHFKGGFVLVLFCAKHSDREEVEVVYKGLNNGKFYARPIESFCEVVDSESGKQPRFSLSTTDDAKEFITGDIRGLIKTFNI